MDDLNLHYRFVNWRRRIREIREVRAVRYHERFKHILVDGDTLSYHGNSGEVGCYVARHPLTKDNNYFEVSIVDSGVRGTIAVGLVPQYYSLDHQPGWLPDSVAYHADDGKLYNGRAKGRQFGTKCSSGDRIGCGIEPVSFEVQTAQIFFTKNGKRWNAGNLCQTGMHMSPMPQINGNQGDICGTHEMGIHRHPCTTHPPFSFSGLEEKTNSTLASKGKRSSGEGKQRGEERSDSPPHGSPSPKYFSLL